MKNIFLIFFILIMSGCGIFPGMQNLDTEDIPVEHNPYRIPTNPLIIPITPLLLVENPLPPYIYCVAPQDVLSITVWSHPEFIPPAQQLALASSTSSQAAGMSGYLVNPDGNIYFPLVGTLHVAGKTVEQIRIELSCRLREYIRHPQVIVRVADYRSKKVYVLGEIMKPGLFPLNDQPMTIADAITLAGSFDPLAADTRHIYVIRGDILQPRIYWLKATTPDTLLLATQFQLQPNDIIYVSAAIVTRWNRFLNQLLPTVQTIWYTKAVTGK